MSNYMFSTESSYIPNNADLIETDPLTNTSLYLGNIIAYKDIDFLYDNKINLIISLCEDVELFKLPLVEKHIKIPIDDSVNQEILSKFNDCFMNIDDARKKGMSVYIHCQAGVSRSSAFVIGYLMKKNKWCFEKAYVYVKSKRPFILPNSGFIRQLRKYEKDVSEILNIKV